MTPTLQIRLATVSDAREIASMSRDLIEHGLPWTWRPERVARAIAAPDTNVAVVRDTDKLLGFGIMEHLDIDAYLVLFAVRAITQRQGIGGELLSWLEGSALVAGALRIRLEARRDNVAARCFYNERGYHEVAIASRRYSGTLDGIHLEKWLRVTDRSDA